ncbi:hypothetical protein ACFQ0M_45895 [Kitasatospora aburaviensis]
MVALWAASVLSSASESCAGGLDAGGGFALVLLMPALFVVQLGVGYVLAFVASRSGVLFMFRDPGLARFATIVTGVLAVAAATIWVLYPSGVCE